MSKVIIAIHGLGNKPPKSLLKKWWKKSMREGLKVIGHPRFFIPFEFVYWAHLVHPQPLDPKVKDKKHPLFLDEPYRPAKSYAMKKRSIIRQKVLDYVGKQIDKLFLNEDMSLNFSAVSDIIIKRYFYELDIYYSQTCFSVADRNCLARDVIREQLARVLKKHQGKQILLIGHSMGSIIAYDVLTQTLPDVPIDTLVTIGSPLGMPIIISKIVSEQSKKMKQTTEVKTPENIVHHWYNFSDLEDKVAIDYSLAGDFKTNSRNVGVTDKIIDNNYEIDGHRNPHKSYGYLRAPEFAEIIHTFLTAGKSAWSVRLTDLANQFLDKCIFWK